MVPSPLLDADLHYLATNSKDLKNRTQVRVYVGTREIVGRVIIMENDVVQPGQNAGILRKS